MKAVLSCPPPSPPPWSSYYCGPSLSVFVGLRTEVEQGFSQPLQFAFHSFRFPQGPPGTGAIFDTGKTLVGFSSLS